MHWLLKSLGRIALPSLFWLVALAAPSSAEPSEDCRLAAALPGADQTGVGFDSIDPTTALPACRAAVAADPRDMASLVRLARVLSRADQADEARALLAQHEAGGHPDLVAYLGVLVRDGTPAHPPDPDGAIGLFDRAARLGSPFGAMRLHDMHAEAGPRPDPARAAAALDRAVELGLPEALTARARELSVSDLPGDPERAIELLLRAEAAGQADAAYLLGFYHDVGQGVAEDDARALYWYARETARFDQGDVVADAWLRSGMILKEGSGTAPADPVAAIAAFERAADLGIAEAMWHLGSMASKGQGQPVDLRKGLALYRQAERAGDAYSAIEIGFAYVVGDATVQDYAEAARWFRKALDRENGAFVRRRAAINLGLRYHYGFDNERNLEAALSVMAEALASDDPGAMLEAGRIMIEEEDPALVRRGFMLLLRAASRGDVSAQASLGWAYANGKGTEEDYVSAARWYERAALGGNHTSARNLAELYEKGHLGAVDMEAAISWYRRAADAGQSTARRRLADILSRSDDPGDVADALGYLIADAEALVPEAAEMLATVIDDPGHPLHALALGADHAPQVKQIALSIGASFEEPVVSCVAIATGCTSSKRRVHLASAAAWFRRAIPEPMADFRLARLLLAHPELARSAGEAEAALARAAASGLSEAVLLLAMQEQGPDAPADAILAQVIAELEPEAAADLAALAAMARFGDAMVGPGWSALRDASAQGEAGATSVFLRVLLFYGAFDRAAEVLEELPSSVALDLTGVDYTLEQILSLWLNELGKGFDPAPRLIAALDRLLPELVRRGAAGAERLDIMLAEVKYRLEQREVGLAPAEALEIGIGRSVDDRLADIEQTIADYTNDVGLAAQLVPVYRHRAELLAQKGDLDAAREALFEGTALAMEINDQTRHLSGTLIYEMERACILRKTSDALYGFGDAETGLAFAKAAANALQAARQALIGLPQDMQSCFRDAIADQYRSLAGLMIDAGQLTEAQEILTQLSDFETYRFWQEDSALVGQAFAPVPVRRAVATLVERVAGLGLAELNDLRARLDNARDIGDAPAVARLERELELAQAALAQSLDDLGDRVDARLETLPQGPAADAAEDLAADISARTVRRLQGRLEEVPGLAAVYSVSLPDRTHFLIVTASGTEHVALEMGADALTSLVDGFRNALQGTGTGQPQDKAGELFAKVWAPVEQALQVAGSTDVLLSLDSPMRQLPIGALHDGKSWLLEHRRYVSFTPAGQDLLLDDSPLELTAVEAMGTSEGGAGFSTLPNVTWELQGIVRETEADQGILPGTIRLNADFDAVGLAEALDSGAPVIHIASHFDLRDRDDRSVLLLGGGETLSMANLKDGIRKGRYDLSGVDMMVLSACQTALDGSAGLESLASAMHGEGVRTVLATLWSVPDRSTALFMQRYYEHLSAGAGRAEALRLTQLDFLAAAGATLPDSPIRGAEPLDDAAVGPSLADLSHPRAWAGFQLTGQWR